MGGLASAASCGPPSPDHPIRQISTMALNIEDPETERLAAEVAAMTGESKTGAIRTALRERRHRLALEHTDADRERALRALLEEEVWPSLPGGNAGPSTEPRRTGRDPRLPTGGVILDNSAMLLGFFGEPERDKFRRASVRDGSRRRYIFGPTG